MAGDAREHEAHFRMLVGLCWADGDLAPMEERHLLRAAERLGIAEERARGIIGEGAAASEQAAPPEEPDVRLRRFLELIRIAFADGKVVAEEQAFLAAVGERYGIPADKVRAMLAT